MRIREYSSLDELTDEDLFVVETVSGTKNITAKNANLTGLTQSDDPAIVHRNLYRGKNLGNTYTQAQKNAIKNGTFNDIYVGDYWQVGDNKWRVADINYFNDTYVDGGSKAKYLNHVVVMPDKFLYKAKMNNDLASLGTQGYAQSYMRTAGLNQAKTTINGIFGAENILKYTDYMLNGINTTTKIDTSKSWETATVEIPNNAMIFGYANNYTGAGSTNISRITMKPAQLSMFSLNPGLIQPNTDHFWMRDVITDGGGALAYCRVHAGSLIDTASVSGENGVRPVFAITG